MAQPMRATGFWKDWAQGRQELPEGMQETACFQCGRALLLAPDNFELVQTGEMLIYCSRKCLKVAQGKHKPGDWYCSQSRTVRLAKNPDYEAVTPDVVVETGGGGSCTNRR